MSATPAAVIDAAPAWRRLLVALALSTIGGVGMWSVVVALPIVQAEFGVDRAGASVPYTLLMVGVAAGGLIGGRLTDRFGVALPMMGAAAALCAGYVGAGLSQTLWQFALAHLVIGALGSGVSFGPLIADISHWFARRRGLAVALVACGNYIAGTIWPPLVQWSLSAHGWRATHIAIGLACLLTMLPLSALLRRSPPAHAAGDVGLHAPQPLPVSAPMLMALLTLAGLACCVAMAMPQVHIVAYCGDLGYGVARGAEMLSLMLGFGVVSRIASGFIADRIGGLATLLLGSVLQALALFLYLLFDGLTSLYLISALFGLVQGGIVPSYAVVIRAYFPAREAATRLGIVLMATLLGMALGGWLSGLIFDVTGSYAAAFAHGLAWNVLHVAIVAFLMLGRPRARLAPA